MSQPLHPIRSWVAALAAAAFLAASPARSAPVDACEAYAGSITTDSTQQCLVNGSVTLVAQPGGDAVVPDGYQIGYVLTSTNGLAIEQVGPDPSFTVSGVNIWRIHSLVYDPSTLDFAAILDLDHAYELQDLLVQGGGTICASLNISGAFTKTTECPDGCAADAGTISALNPDLCLVDGTAQLEALPDGNSNVPPGYSVAHVLTTGPDLTILAVGAEPSFSVDFAGPFTIHTLVYDPATLDLSGILFGETSGFEIAALLQQGGGPVCGSLDATGAQFQVADCDPVCTAFAGTMTAVDGEVCRVDGIALLDAAPNGDAVVPDGYAVAYILARANGIIENVEPFTLFEWPLLGEYVIHTLVYDPFTIDPFDVVLGTTTVAEINAVLLQGGGPVCGSLDLVGAAFTVIDCAPPCTAYAGVGGDRILCYTDPVTDLFTLLSDSPDEGGSWSGPDGQAFSGSFNPATDDQGVYVYFVTDGPDCPGDTTNLVISLIECPDPCDADAGPDASIVLCTNEATLNLSTLIGGDVGGSWTDPNGQAFSGVFVPAIGEAGTYTYVVGASGPCSGDTALVDVDVNVAANAGSDGSVTLCASGPAVSLFEQLNGNPQIGGTWYGPDASANSGVLAPGTDDPGTYIYVVQGTSPCANDTATITVSINTAPDAGLSAQIVLCSSDAPLVCFGALGGSPDAGGTWTGPNGVPFSGTFDPATDPSGLYIYTVPGEAPCVDDQATLVIIVQDCCDAGTAADTTVCFTDVPFSMIDALGGAPCPGGVWADPAAQAHGGVFNPALDASGSYTYTVVNSNGSVDQSTLTISVIECPNNCDADAGTLSNEEPEVCLQNGSAILASVSNGDASIPPGYISAFLLSSGPELTLLAVENSPFFVVNAPGLYTIHTLVYDPNTLDLSTVGSGTTTGGDVNALLIQGGGNICASLDVAGAQFLVSECADPCAGSTPDAGIGGDIIRCTVDPITELFDLLQGTPDVGGTWTAPDGTAFPGAFDPASDASGVYVYTVFDLLDCAPDTTQLNISVIDCPEGQQQLVAWPNPSTTQVNVRFPEQLGGGATIDIIDALGRSVRPMTTVNGNLVTVDVSGMPAGAYTLRVRDGRAAYMGRFTRSGD